MSSTLPAFRYYDLMIAVLRLVENFSDVDWDDSHISVILSLFSDRGVLKVYGPPEVYGPVEEYIRSVHVYLA